MIDWNTLPRLEGDGLFFMADPHLADIPPGQRLEGYLAQIFDKVEAGLQEAERRNHVPVFLGDLFHWPRDNSNAMLVELIRMFGSRTGIFKPWVLVGNHDKYQSRFTDDVSLAVLGAAGVAHIMKDKGPQFRLSTKNGDVLVCASPDGTTIPKKFDMATEFGEENGAERPQNVIWLTHHNIRFPEFLDRAYDIREIPGVDWVVNGHIHRPQQTMKTGMTTWANPGNTTRLTFTRRTKERVPAAAIWTPGLEELEVFPLPFLAFDKVFPDQEFPPEQQEIEGGSDFIRGLERLAWKRTREGAGLKQFLTDNLGDSDESRVIWGLYEEIMDEK